MAIHLYRNANMLLMMYALGNYLNCKKEQLQTHVIMQFTSMFDPFSFFHRQLCSCFNVYMDNLIIFL